MSSPSAPLFSIIIPLHNKGNYILETLQSVQKQTFKNWECWVIENNSTDDGPQKVQSIQDSRIHLLKIQTQGPSKARNEGLKNAQGKWILFLDADDLIPENFLQSHQNAFYEQPGRDIYATPWEEHHPDGKIEIKEPFGAKVSRDEMLASCLLYPPFCVQAAIVRREVITPEFEWPESLDQYIAEDTVFWFKLLHVASVAFHSETRPVYRINQSGCRNQLDQLGLFYESYEKVIKLNLHFLHVRKLKTNARQAYYLYTFYQKMQKRAASENAESILKNAEMNLKQLFLKLSPWDKLKIHVKSWLHR